MNTLKIYLNENLSWKIAKALREYGYDVVSSHETGMNTEEDDIQFAFAVSEKRAVLTNNFSDFIALYQVYASEGKGNFAPGNELPGYYGMSLRDRMTKRNPLGRNPVRMTHNSPEIYFRACFRADGAAFHHGRYAAKLWKDI